MAYTIQAYNEQQTVFEVVNDGIPEFYGTQDECQSYIDNLP